MRYASPSTARPRTSSIARLTSKVGSSRATRDRPRDVRVPFLAFDMELLVAGVSYGLSEGRGRHTELTLGPAEGSTPSSTHTPAALGGFGAEVCATGADSQRSGWEWKEITCSIRSPQSST
jgi:hypothetical protein